MWLKSQAFHARPSDLIGLTDAFMAYCYDEVVFTWGRFVEGELDKAVAEAHNKSKGRRKKKVDEGVIRQRKLAQLLDMPEQVRYKSFRMAAGKPPLPRKED